MTIRWEFDDAGAVDAGLDPWGPVCLARAIAIAEQRSYADVTADLTAIGWSPDPSAKRLKQSDLRAYLASRGWTRRRALWAVNGQVRTPTGKLVHLDDLPRRGRIIAMLVSKHAVAVVDGVARDAFDSRSHPKGGPDIVFAWYTKEEGLENAARDH